MNDNWKFFEVEGKIVERYVHDSANGVKPSYLILEVEGKKETKQFRFDTFKQFVYDLREGYIVNLKCVVDYRLFGEQYTRDRGDGVQVPSGGWDVKAWACDVIDKSVDNENIKEHNTAFEKEISNTQSTDNEDDSELPF